MVDVQKAGGETPLSPEYFETYKIQPGDLETLGKDIDDLSDADLLEDGILEGLRFVTHDSSSVYVFTKGGHASRAGFKVEELPTRSARGFRLFKMAHSGSIGKSREEYKGAYAGVAHEVREQLTATAEDSSKDLEAVSIPPYTAYEQIKKKACNYKTDMVFHEAGHIEHFKLQRLLAEEEDAFPSEEQKKRFVEEIRRTALLRTAVMDLIVPHIGNRVIEEMYAMLIDREGSKHFDPVRYAAVSAKYDVIKTQLSSDPPDPEALEHIQEWEHYTGQLLVLILEELFPDFRERKKFVRECLDPKQQP